MAQLITFDTAETKPMLAAGLLYKINKNESNKIQI